MFSAIGLVLNLALFTLGCLLLHISMLLRHLYYAVVIDPISDRLSVGALLSWFQFGFTLLGHVTVLAGGLGLILLFNWKKMPKWFKLAYLILVGLLLSFLLISSHFRSHYEGKFRASLSASFNVHLGKFHNNTDSHLIVQQLQNALECCDWYRAQPYGNESLATPPPPPYNRTSNATSLFLEEYPLSCCESAPYWPIAQTGAVCPLYRVKFKRRCADSPTLARLSLYISMTAWTTVLTLASLFISIVVYEMNQFVGSIRDECTKASDAESVASSIGNCAICKEAAERLESAQMHPIAIEEE
jgi:hypothetical protein